MGEKIEKARFNNVKLLLELLNFPHFENPGASRFYIQFKADLQTQPPQSRR